MLCVQFYNFYMALSFHNTYFTIFSSVSLMSCPSISYPIASQPSVFWRAKSSILGRLPIRETILSRTSSGFLLCSRRGERITCFTDLDLRDIFPLTPNKHISAFALVQYPIPVNGEPSLFCLTHTKATVLKENPHDFITCSASLNCGSTAHKNKTLFSAA